MSRYELRISRKESLGTEKDYAPHLDTIFVRRKTQTRRRQHDLKPGARAGVSPHGKSSSPKRTPSASDTPYGPTQLSPFPPGDFDGAVQKALGGAFTESAHLRGDIWLE